MLESFSPDYATARERFLDAVPRAGGLTIGLPVDGQGPDGDPLSIDVAWFGAAKPRTAVLHIAGTHGVDGFTAAAAQLTLLEQGLPPIPDGVAVILVHCLNPYGMAWLRRADADNIDLNRNLCDDHASVGMPDAYAQLDGLLNPASPPSMDFFPLRLRWTLLRSGPLGLQRAMQTGQSTNPRGLFYVGAGVQPALARFLDWLSSALADAARIISVDVHAGSQDMLMVDADTLPGIAERFSSATARPVDEAGTLAAHLPQRFPDADVIALSQELRASSAVRILHALREENRWHHYGDGDVQHNSRRRLQDALTPPVPGWRREAAGRCLDLIADVFDMVGIVKTSE